MPTVKKGKDKSDFSESQSRQAVQDAILGMKKTPYAKKHFLHDDGTVPEKHTITTGFKKTIAPPTERVPTGIVGLDKIMQGGFERGSVNLVGGGAGAGKSILCMQFLINGATMFNEPGIYITFEETRKKILKHMAEFGWDIEKLEDDGKLSILEYTPQQVGKLLQEGAGIIESMIEKMGVKRIVFDSLTAFTMLHKSELEKIESSLALFKMMQKWGITSLVTAESDPDPEHHKSTIMEFEVDGVLLLYSMRRDDNTRERALEILKLRGLAHSTKIFPMKILREGIHVYPEEEIF